MLSSTPLPGPVIMGDLIKLSTSKGDVRILESSAVKFEDIGTILLKDDRGAIVSTTTRTALGNPDEAIRMIYKKWIQEDEDHSWRKLIQCFKDVQLNSLAKDIERHFGLHSSSGIFFIAQKSLHSFLNFSTDASQRVSEEKSQFPETTGTILLYKWWGGGGGGVCLCLGVLRYSSPTMNGNVRSLFSPFV